MFPIVNGWIKVHRQIKEWEFYTDIKTFKLWLHLLLSCNIVPQKRVLGYTLQPGQIITTLPKLSGETGLSEKEIRTALGKLEKGRQITQIRTNKFRLITIENWGFYQAADADTGRQRADKTEEKGSQRAGIKKECKELKNNNTIAPCRKAVDNSKPKNRFINYTQSDWDFDELDRLEREQRNNWFAEDEEMVKNQVTLDELDELDTKEE